MLRFSRRQTVWKGGSVRIGDSTRHAKRFNAARAGLRTLDFRICTKPSQGNSGLRITARASRPVQFFYAYSRIPHGNLRMLSHPGS